MVAADVAALGLDGSLRSQAVSAIVLAVGAVGGVLGFWHGRTVPLRRQERGLPRADPVRVAQHDTFNLCLLPLLVLCDAACLAGAFDPSLFTALFLVYVLLDLAWIWARPEAVPQPALVLTHHVGVLALLSHPLRWPEHAHFTATVAIVEINTVILVGRRHFASYLLQLQPGRGTGQIVRSIVRQSLSVFYWISFFIIRFGVHPYMVWVSLEMDDVPLLEKVLLVSLLSMLCVFSAVLLVKQIYGQWDARRQHPEPLPQYELFLDPERPKAKAASTSAEADPCRRAAPGVLEFPWTWRRQWLGSAGTSASRLERSDPEPEPEVVVDHVPQKDDNEEDPSDTVPTDVTELGKQDGSEDTASENFCGVEQLLAAAVAAGKLPTAATRSELRRIVPMTAGFCNRVHRVHIDGHGRDDELDLVVKEFSALSRARSTASAFATDRLIEAHGSPRQMFSSQRGVVHEFCDGKVELTEADVGTSGSRATVKSVARAVANLHCIPPSRLPPGIPRTPMVWVSVDTMLRRLVQHTAAGKLPAAPASRTWNVQEVVQVCARERALIERAGYEVVLGHGDLKPTNVLARRSRSEIDQDDGYSDAVLIDFELSGVNYRGFDLCKLFRNDAGAIDTSEAGPLWSFLNEYRVCCQKSNGVAFMPSVESLAAEAAALEPATWLEASVFFMTVLCEAGFTAEQYEVAERLSTHRWERYLQLRPEFKS